MGLINNRSLGYKLFTNFPLHNFGTEIIRIDAAGTLETLCYCNRRGNFKSCMIFRLFKDTFSTVRVMYDTGSLWKTRFLNTEAVRSVKLLRIIRQCFRSLRIYFEQLLDYLAF